MKTRITLSLPEEIVVFARIEAAKVGKSMSRWLGDLVASWCDEEKAGGRPASSVLNEAQLGTTAASERRRRLR